MNRDIRQLVAEVATKGARLRLKDREVLVLGLKALPTCLVKELRARRDEVKAYLEQVEIIPWAQRLAGMPAIPPPPEDPLAEAEKAAEIILRDGYVLLWAETVQDYIAFVRDEGMIAQVPPGFVIYTDTELKELFDKGRLYSPATLRLIHEAKKQGGKVANGP